MSPQQEQLDLAADQHLPVLEIHVIGREAEDFALTETETGTEQNHQAESFGKFIVHSQNTVAVHCQSFLRSDLGRRTDGALHGFLGINSSSTAAVKMVDTLANTTFWEVGARPTSVRSHP